MKTVLLTTDTPHHAYFAQLVNETFPWKAIFLETEQVKPPFETAHAFERARDEYEQEELLAGIDFRDGISDVAPTRAFSSLNEPECVEALKRMNPEVVIVFGTGLLKPPIIDVVSINGVLLNLHGGDPEEYRGLDTHLWAIYHDDWNSLVTTLHYVNPGLDAGDIVLQEQLQLSRNTKLHELRAINTQACVNLVLMALGSLKENSWLPRRKQRRCGRYYSLMPATLKGTCQEKFNRHVATL